jgi:predicted phage tail protein
VKAVNTGGSSAYSNIATVSVLVSAAPTNPNVTAVANGATALVTLTWTDNANNETGFRIQRASNATFTAGLNTSTVGANTVTLQQNRNSRTTYYYRIQSYNSVGASVWVNFTPFPIVTP